MSLKMCSNLLFLSVAMLAASALAQDVVPESPPAPAPAVEESAGESRAASGSQAGYLQPQVAGPSCQAAPCNQCYSQVEKTSRLREYLRFKKLKHQYKWWGYPEEFEEIPFGTFTNMQLTRQMETGEAARLVLYHYDFVQDENGLTPRGKYQLAKMISMLSRCECSLVIQQTADEPELDEARRVAVLTELAQRGLSLSADRVIIGVPSVKGLQGIEAQSVNRNFQQNTESRGGSLRGSNSFDLSIGSSGSSSGGR